MLHEWQSVYTLLRWHSFLRFVCPYNYGKYGSVSMLNYTYESQRGRMLWLMRPSMTLTSLCIQSPVGQELNKSFFEYVDITKTRLFKYTENFTTKKLKIFR